VELVRYLTIGSINRYRLRGRTATDPTVNPLIGSGSMGKPRTICEYTRIPVYVKCFVKIILGSLCTAVQIAESRSGGGFLCCLLHGSFAPAQGECTSSLLRKRSPRSSYFSRHPCATRAGLSPGQPDHAILEMQHSSSRTASADLGSRPFISGPSRTRLVALTPGILLADCRIFSIFGKNSFYVLRIT
jgi:hypothetical protein